ncbi:MAG TPA: DUF3311 domain-containing protein [Pseudonocardiaceae bacterium]|jgi:hypothetical protein
MSSSPPDERRSGLRFNAWNLLLLVPLLMLITPWFNSDSPRLIGLPFFYWFQFLFVVVGVACVWIVYAMTKKPANRSKSDDAEGRS